MKIKNLNKYSYFLGLIILGIILIKIDLRELKNTFYQINIKYFIAAGFLTIPMLLNKAWCWQYLTKKQGISYSLKNSFLMYGSGIFLGSVTPGKIGDFAKIFYLKKDGHSPIKAFVATLVDRFLDLGVFLTISFIGLLFFTALFKRHLILSGVLLTTIMLITTIFLKNNFYKKLAKKIFYKITPQKYQETWKININGFWENLKVYKLKNYLTAILITLTSLTFYFGQMKLIALGLGLTQISLIYLIFAVSIAGLISLIPISIAGIGTRDAALIIIFGKFLISKELALIFSASILLLTLVFVPIGFICYLLKPIRIKTN